MDSSRTPRSTGWRAAASTTRPPRRRQAPDLSDFETFARLVPQRGAYLAWPLMLLLFAAWSIGVGLYLRPYQTARTPIDREHVDEPVATVFELLSMWPPWSLLLAVGAVLLVWAPVHYLRRRHDHPRYLRELYDEVRRDGVLVETFPSRLRLEADEGTAPAEIAIDVRVTDAQAVRLHSAFGDWLDGVRHDPAAIKAVGSLRILSPGAAGHGAVRPGGGRRLPPPRRGHQLVANPAARRRRRDLARRDGP
ncbi:hypothetical protein [Jiangella gansuensis]|uniref:hypothetical protein n=1 Tax=Jiangella gansuensis TaxID=281473 RepID=UPI0004B7E466|nr:hypothetical protein [Jiangella gansuensis]